MAVVVNNPTPATHDTNNATGFLMGLVIFVAIAFLLFYFLLPIMRNAMSGYGSAPQVNVPDKVDVNVKSNGGAPNNGQ